MKVIRQILNLRNTKEVSEDDDGILFTLSDVIDEDNLNMSALIRHLMFVWEIILGKSVGKCETLTLFDIQQLQTDLSPLVSS